MSKDEPQAQKTVRLEFSLNARQRHGSSIAAVTNPATGAVREIEYTCWSEPPAESAGYKWPDKLTVYEGPAKNVKFKRKECLGTMELVNRMR